MPSSLIMKRDVAWQLSALGPERARMFQNIEPMSSGAPDGFFKGPSCITTPVSPVQQMRIASSSRVSGHGAFALWYESGPARMEHPSATRRVRRSLIACRRGYERMASSPGCRGDAVLPEPRCITVSASSVVSRDRRAGPGRISLQEKRIIYLDHMRPQKRIPRRMHAVVARQLGSTLPSGRDPGTQIGHGDQNSTLPGCAGPESPSLPRPPC